MLGSQSKLLNIFWFFPDFPDLKWFFLDFFPAASGRNYRCLTIITDSQNFLSPQKQTASDTSKHLKKNIDVIIPFHLPEIYISKYFMFFRKHWISKAKNSQNWWMTLQSEQTNTTLTLGQNNDLQNITNYVNWLK